MLANIRIQKFIFIDACNNLATERTGHQGEISQNRLQAKVNSRGQADRRYSRRHHSKGMAVFDGKHPVRYQKSLAQELKQE